MVNATAVKMLNLVNPEDPVELRKINQPQDNRNEERKEELGFVEAITQLATKFYDAWLQIA
jgi:hypothetical protein